MADPYKALVDSIQSLNEPYKQLLDNHDRIVSQNLNIMNNLKELNNFNSVVNNKPEKK